MSQNHEVNASGIFSFLYHTRVKVMKEETTIVNLSLAFSLVSLLCAPWLVVIGAVVALALGYRFTIVRRAQGFSENWNSVVHSAADHVKSAVDQFGGNNGDRPDGSMES